MRKPHELCQTFARPPLRQLEHESDEFMHELAQHDLRYRMATRQDRDTLFAFLLTIHSYEELEPLPVIDRLLRFSYVSIIETWDHRIIAGQIAESHNDDDGTIHGLRYAVDPAFRGLGLGAKLVRQHAYDCARYRGARVRRGTVDPRNLPSMINLLNHVGCVADAFETVLYAPTSLLTIEVSLSPHGLTSNRIDMTKAQAFARGAGPHEDCTVISCEDLDAIAALYRDTKQRIVAVLPDGLLLAVTLDIRV